MPATRNQSFRQEIIHSLLGTSGLQLTKCELLERVNDRLTQLDLNPIHWRTLNNDLTWLKSCGADIHVPDRGDPHYYYNETFYPEGTSFDDEDFDILRKGIEILKRIAGFRVAHDIEAILGRMKYVRYREDPEEAGFIAFEDHTMALGTEWLDALSDAIRMKTVLRIDYRPFIQPGELFLFHPYFLKEYRNRWFVLGRHQVKNALYTLALDRILSLRTSIEDTFIDNDLFDPSTWFDDLIGVTRPEGSIAETVRMIVSSDSAGYVETKKIHKSQQLIRRMDAGSIEVELCVVVNYELVSTILGFGAAVKVTEPSWLVNRLMETLKETLDNY